MRTLTLKRKPRAAAEIEAALHRAREAHAVAPKTAPEVTSANSSARPAPSKRRKPAPSKADEPRLALAALCPGAGAFDETRPLVVKRIRKQALERWPDMDEKALLSALNRYAASRPYLEAICRKRGGGFRHDLDGNAVSPITSQERKLARAKLAALAQPKEPKP